MYSVSTTSFVSSWFSGSSSFLTVCLGVFFSGAGFDSFSGFAGFLMSILPTTFSELFSVSFGASEAGFSSGASGSFTGSGFSSSGVFLDQSVVSFIKIVGSGAISGFGASCFLVSLIACV